MKRDVIDDLTSSSNFRGAPALSDAQKLAITCRLLADEGHMNGVAGQITARVGDGTYLTLPFGIGFDEANASGLIRVDDTLRSLEDDRRPNPATRFHLWIYGARADVRCVIHTHPPFVSALSMVGEPLAVAHMDATPFHDDCAYLADWPGVPVADVEGRLISEALGSKRSVLLAHHGQVTVGASIEEAACLAIFLERAAAMQVRARAIGPLRTIDPDRARESHDFILSETVINVNFNYFSRRMTAKYPDCLS